MQNGFIDRFNKFFREDVLPHSCFRTLNNYGLLLKSKHDYNYFHPQSSLWKLSPCQFAPRSLTDLDSLKQNNKKYFVKLQTV